MRVEFYKHTSSSTGLSYIGLTSKTLQERFEHHKHFALMQNSETHFHRAIRKYGADDFVSELLEFGEYTDITEAGYREIELIAECDTFKNGYNMTKGGSEMPIKKGAKTMYKDGIYARVDIEKHSQYLNDGWVLKRKPTNNVTWINDKKIEKRVSNDTLQQYISDGWVKGKVKRLWITNITENKRVPEDTLTVWINKGWTQGKTMLSEKDKNKGSKISKSRTGMTYTYSEEGLKKKKQQLRATHSNGIYHTPAGDFFSSRDAAKANGFKCNDTIINKCIKNKTTGWSFTHKNKIENWEGKIKGQ